MPSHQNRLGDDQRDFILMMLAEYRGPAYICRQFQKTFHRSIASSLVMHYKQSARHQGQIDMHRQRLRATILTHIPLASKFYRLKELDALFHSENHHRIVRYCKGVNSRGQETHVPIYEKPVGELRAICQLIASEMGDLREVHEIVDHSQDEYVATFEGGEAYSEKAEAATPEVVPEETTH